MRSLHPLTSARQYHRAEQGWTLVELLVVILITGVLASIAVVAFMAQRERAAEAQVISDVRNAATIMEDAYVDDSRYPANLPNYAKFTDASMIYTDITVSGPQNFCLMGTHRTYEDIEVSYDSLQGGLLNRGEECVEPDESWGAGDSWRTALDESKIAIVEIRNNNSDAARSIRNILVNSGIPIENISILTGTRPAAAELEDYALVVGAGGISTLNDSQLTYLAGLQSAGINVLTDGRLTGDDSPFVEGYTHFSGTPPFYRPTYARMTPAFPYIFPAQPLQTAGGWNCWHTLSAEAVSVAEDTRGDHTCSTVIAHRNNGLWLHMIAISSTTPQVTEASLLWLLS